MLCCTIALLMLLCTSIWDLKEKKSPASFDTLYLIFFLWYTIKRYFQVLSKGMLKVYSCREFEDILWYIAVRLLSVCQMMTHELSYFFYQTLVLYNWPCCWGNRAPRIWIRIKAKAIVMHILCLRRPKNGMPHFILITHFLNGGIFEKKICWCILYCYISK